MTRAGMWLGVVIVTAFAVAMTGLRSNLYQPQAQAVGSKEELVIAADTKDQKQVFVRVALLQRGDTPGGQQCLESHYAEALRKIATKRDAANLLYIWNKEPQLLFKELKDDLGPRLIRWCSQVDFDSRSLLPTSIRLPSAPLLAIKER